jgi:hypothetical protein
MDPIKIVTRSRRGQTDRERGFAPVSLAVTGDAGAEAAGEALPDGVRAVGRMELTRRRFVSGTAKLGLGVAAATGAVVGFAPAAAAAVACAPGSRSSFRGCTQSAIGRCSTVYSYCVYKTGGYNGYKYRFRCFCGVYCYAAKAFCKCNEKANEGYGSGYGCCVYC